MAENQLTIGNGAWGVMPAEARNVKINSDALGAAIQGSFGVLSYKGKNWAVRYHGQTHPIWQYDASGRPIGTVPSLEIVILNVSPTLAKTYYEGGYVDGSTDAPDCWSPNAIVPDPSSPKVQSSTCSTCRWNRFGSKTTEDGRQSKACQDHKRLAFVPAGDMKNDRFGGPMLMRVPPASLTGVLDYSDKLKASGWEFYALVTQISFDPTKAYPLIQFNEVRPLKAEEIAYVHHLQDDPRVARIINEGVEFDPMTPEQMAERGLPQSGTQSTVTAAASVAPQTTQQPPAPQPSPAVPGGWGAPTPTYPAGNAALNTAPTQQGQAGGGFGGQTVTATAQQAPQPPAEAVQPEYRYSPDGALRWKPGMAGWEAVPKAAPEPPPLPATVPAQATAAPAAAQTRKSRKPRTPPVSPGTGTNAATAATTPAPAPDPTGGQAPPPVTGAWGGPPPQPNGQAGQPAPAGAQNDAAMASFDERLGKLL